MVGTSAFEAEYKGLKECGKPKVVDTAAFEEATTPSGAEDQAAIAENDL